jgi:hypothetical protein
MTKHPRPAPEVTRLETHGPDGVVIARMERNADSRVVVVWTLEVFPGSDNAKAALGVFRQDGRWATKALTVDEAKSVLDYATHAVLTAMERIEDAQTALLAGIDKATTMTAQQTLPIGD